MCQIVDVWHCQSRYRILAFRDEWGHCESNHARRPEEAQSASALDQGVSTTTRRRGDPPIFFCMLLQLYLYFLSKALAQGNRKACGGIASLILRKTRYFGEPY